MSLPSLIVFKPNAPLDFLVVQYLSGVPAKMAIEQAGADCTERNIQKMAKSCGRVRMGPVPKGGVMSGADITVAVHAVFIAAPGQTCTRSSLAGKQQGAAFLAALPAPWTTLLPPARVACQAAAEAAAAATDAAIAAAAAAVTDHNPPAAPSVVAAGAVTAAAVDLASMSSAERRELLAKLGGFMGDE